MNFHAATPILRVKSLEKSIRYYVGRLGFAPDFEGPAFASVSRGRATVFLAEGDQGHPGSWVWIGVGDVDLLHAELRKKRAKIRQGPTNFPWACEIQVEDPDGNVLRFGSDPKKDVPYGPWLGMRGRKRPAKPPARRRRPVSDRTR